MNTNHTPPRPRLRMSIGFGDLLFALLFVGAAFLLADNGFRPPLEDPRPALEAADPWFSAAILIPAAAILALVFAVGSKIDRRCAEDYVFQLIANAALVAATTTIFAYGIWQFASDVPGGLRPPVSDDLMALLILSWATGWFTFRVRGVS